MGEPRPKETKPSEKEHEARVRREHEGRVRREREALAVKEAQLKQIVLDQMRPYRKR